MIQETRLDSSGSLFGRLQSSYELSWGAGFDTGWDSFLEKSSSRQAGTFAGSLLVLNKVPDEVPFRGVASLAEAPLYLVPRSLWPSKPSLSNGIEVSIVFYDQPSYTPSSSTLLLFGEGYWYLGVTGVAVLSLEAGLLLGVIDRYLASGVGPAIRACLLPTLVAWRTTTCSG